MTEELIHMSCMGLLCEPLWSKTIGKVTHIPEKVTCPKCKEILIKTIGR